MPSKRVRTLVRATPLRQNGVNDTSDETSEEPNQHQNADDLVYDSDVESEAKQTAPIATANLVTEIRAHVVLGNRVENMAPVVLDNEVTNAMAPLMVTSATNIMAPIATADQVTNSAASLRAAADIMDPSILQMGNVVRQDQTNTITDLTHQTVFNMRTAVSLTDTVNETLAAKFLVQARDPTFKGRWDSHIQPHALFLIRLRLHDPTYRTLCPLDEIPIWPNRLPNELGEPQQPHTMR